MKIDVYRKRIEVSISTFFLIYSEKKIKNLIVEYIFLEWA
jgi:hypothetical protein